MAHTPGPWSVNPQPDPTAPRYATIYVKPGDHTTVDHVAQVGDHLTKHSGDWQANAHLIASAPELLFALKDLVGAVYEHGTFIPNKPVDQANRIIRKAEGRE